MIILLAISLLVAFISLVLASQLPAPGWIWALNGVGIALAIAALAAVGLVLSRVRIPKRLESFLLPLVSAVAALIFHRWLLSWLAPTETAPPIDFLRIQMAALATIGAIFALIGGVASLSRGGSWYHMLAAGAAVTIGLYVLGPILIRVGVPVDWRAFLGLSALGMSAFAVVEAARRVKTP